MKATWSGLARTAATAPHDEALSRALVAWWRASRHPRLAELAIAVAKRRGATIRAVIGTSRKTVDHEAWLALAVQGDPLDMPRLLAALPHTTTVQALERLRALADRDDPHLVPGLFALLREPASKNRSGQPLWRYVIALLSEARDVRVRAEVDAYLPKLSTYMDSAIGDWLRNQLVELLDAVPASPPELGADERDALAKLERTITLPPPSSGRSRANAAAVLDEIYAAPDDLGARAVYADIVGGLVGEFIVAQLAGSQHVPTDFVRDELLGPLGGICKSARFVNGFPEEVAIWKQRPSTIRPAIGLAGWALVRSIRIEHVASWQPTVVRAAVALLTHPVMRRLDELDGVAAEALPALAAMPSASRLATLGIDPADGGVDGDALAAFTALRTLSITAWRGEPFALPAAVLARLDRLVVRTNILAWWRVLDASPIRRATLHYWAWWRLEFERTETGLDRATLVCNGLDNTVAPVFAQLPERALRSLTIRGLRRGTQAQLAVAAAIPPGIAVTYE